MHVLHDHLSMLHLSMQWISLCFRCAFSASSLNGKAVAAAVLTALCVHAVHDRVQLQLAHDENHLHGAACV